MQPARTRPGRRVWLRLLVRVDQTAAALGPFYADDISIAVPPP